MNRLDKMATRRRRQGAWLSTCAMATALAAAPHSARAQAFQGYGTVVTGSADISAGTNTTAVAVGSPETVINWTPFDTGGSGTIDFLPANTTATFNGFNDFTVLNRVLPVDGSGGAAARMVALNGTVNSQIVSTVTSTGGNVWFYTPTGLIVGPTAVMNVGGLVLTTDDIQFTPNDPTTGLPGSIYAAGGAIQFRGPADSTGLIDVQAGAQLNAVGTTSYIAMVAPRIQQAGSVSAERSVGYIAAEQADLTINAGLFNISILAGTTDPNGIVHTGTTTGSASTSGSDVKTISFVALPKSTALTMLLSGSIGYAPAASAFNDGSAVVLSSGYATDKPTAEVAGSLGDISIDNASFTNSTTAYASGKLDITGSGGPVSFSGYTSLYAQDAIAIKLGASEQLTAGDGLSLTAASAGKGGTIDISLGSKAALSGTGYIDLYAYSSAAPFASPAPLNAIGGGITVDANGGALSAQSIYADASAYGEYIPTTAASATGGALSFTSRNGGTISTSSFAATADAYSGYSDTAGGDATAGSITLASQSGALNLGSVTLDAEAYSAPGNGTSGTATGGIAAVSLSGGAYNWDSLNIYTGAVAGYVDGQQGNSASVPSNAVTLTLDNNANLAVANEIYLDASAYATVDGPVGSNAKGGGISVDVGAGSSLAFTSLSGYAKAGIELSFFDDVTPTTTPDLTGGTIDFTADGQVTGHAISLIADAEGLGASTSAGTATGGNVNMLVNSGGNIALDDGAGTSSLELSAAGLGAVGASAANAAGGTADLTLVDGTVDVAGTVSLDAAGQWNQESVFTGSGPNPLTGFNATGGIADVQLQAGTSGTAQLTASSLVVNALGDASTPVFDQVNMGEGGPPAGTYGGPMSVDGGDGTGGTASLSVAAGTLDLSAGGALVEATGQGGISAGSTLGTAFQSGNGFGGIADVGVTGGTSTLGYLAVEGFGVGGGGAFAGGVGELPALAGFGLGGSARVSVGGGALSADSLTLDATGTGGEGGGSDADQAGTNGGDGLGGSAHLISPSGATGQLTSANVLILAGGAGGAGGFGTSDGNGGNGIGGAAGTNLADGAFALGEVILGADGDGGSGVIGGRGTGGSSNFKLVDSSGPSSTRTMGSLSLYANGIGGTGDSGSGASDAGGTGVDVEAFDASSVLGITGDFLADAEGSNAPTGQGFTALIGGAPLTVGGNTSVTTTRDADMSGSPQFHTTGDLTITARSLSASAPLAADGNVAIDARNGISLGSLTSGGTTGLSASNGGITAADLRSTGLVTAAGRSLLIESGAGLTFANATATAGDLRIVTTGGLNSNGPVSATGNVALIGNGGLSAGTVTSGGATMLNAANGAVAVTDLHSPGLVSAAGQSVDIASPGALTFGETYATAGGLTLTALDLAATGPLSASGNVTLDAANGIALGALTSGGTTDLTATNGAISATDLRSGGVVTATGRSIAIASGGGLTFASANATATDLAISTALGLTATGPFFANGNIVLSGVHGISAATVTSGGTTALSAANGAIAVSDLQSPGAVSASGQSVSLVSTGPLTFSGAEATAGDLSLTALDLTATGPLSATGNVALEAANGIAAGTVTSGGTTSLTSDGAIAITDLTSAGLVTAVGGSLTLTSPAALSFANARATGGDLAIVTQGDLALASGSATGNLNLESDAGAVTGTGPLTSGGNALLRGQLGVSAQALVSGGITTVESDSGPVSLVDLSSAGSVTANGTSVAIGSSAGLIFAAADATAGGLTIATAGDLSLPEASATGGMTLSSSGGGITSNTLGAGADFSASGATGLDFTTVQSGGMTSLTSTGGDVTVTDLASTGDVSATGQSVTIGSTGALSFAGAQATAGDLLIAALDLRATGLLSASGNVALDASNGISVGSLSSGGTTTLTSGGAISATDLRSAGPVTAIGGSVAIASGAGLTFGNLKATAGNLGVSTTGDLSLKAASATGALNLASTGGSITATGALSGGGNVSVDGFGGIALPSLTSGGTTLLRSSGGAVSVGSLTSAGLVTASGRSADIASPGALAFSQANATAGNLTISTAGNLALANAGASGGMALTSSGGSIGSTGSITAGSMFSAIGASGLDFASLNSGGTTGLNAGSGDLSVADLHSTDAVTARGRSILISSSAGLHFASATAAGGNLGISTALALSASGNVSAIGDVALTGQGGVSAGTVKSGGTASLDAANGAIAVGDLEAPRLVSASGRSIDIGSQGTLTFNRAVATAGDLTLSAPNLASSGPLSASGNVSIVGQNGIAVGSLVSGGTTLLGSTGAVSAQDLRSTGKVTAFGASIDIASGGALTFDDLQAVAGDARVSTAGDLTLSNTTASGALDLESANGAIAAIGGASAGGDVKLIAAGGIDFPSLTSGGTTLLQSNGGTVSIGLLNSPGLVTAKGGSIDISSPGALAFAAADAAGALSITSAGDLVLPSVNAGGAVALTTSAGNLTVQGDLAGLATTLTSPGDVSIGGDLRAKGALLVAAGGAFTSKGAVSSGAAQIGGATGISLPSLNASGDVVLNSSGGDVTVQELVTSGSVTAAGGDLAIASSDGLRFADVTARGDADLTAAGDVSADGNLSAAGQLSVDAAGLFALNGKAIGDTIAIRSADIDLEEESQLGARGTTQDISLSTKDPAAPLLIGGSSQTEGYTLDNAEAGRLFADHSITIGSLGSGTLGLGSGDITVGDLSLTYGAEGNLGSGGLLSLLTNGTVTVNGAVQLTTGSADDTFSIDPTLIDIVAGQGSIAMLSATGVPQGTLSLTADRIVAATPATFNTIGGLTDLAQISKALAQPGAAGPDGGYLQAGMIDVTAKDGFLVQNGGASDAFPDRRGFTANELDITTGSAATQIAINGLILQDGKSITGLDTAPLVTINGKAATAGGVLDPLSTINGCAIGADCAAPPLPSEPPVTNPAEDDLANAPGKDSPGGQVFTDQLIALGSNAPLITPPLVDEPITGVGNDDLWVSDCTDGGDKPCSGKKEGGE